MAHIVVDAAPPRDEDGQGTEVPDEKKSRKRVKDRRDKSKERAERLEDMKARLDDEREKQQEGDAAKRKLRIIATQKLKSEQEIAAALAQIAAMSPKQAIEQLDLYMAKADASFVEKLADQIRGGLGGVLDFLVGADGHVKQRFAEDQVLLSALVQECSFASSFLNTRAQIAICIGSDTIGGYSDASAKRKLDTRDKEKDDVQGPTA